VGIFEDSIQNRYVAPFVHMLQCSSAIKKVFDDASPPSEDCIRDGLLTKIVLCSTICPFINENLDHAHVAVRRSEGNESFWLYELFQL
jgi:hypothetical protein